VTGLYEKGGKVREQGFDWGLSLAPLGSCKVLSEFS
jgi:hypothetical protein